ncbi:MAG: DUF1552 domain-containing protein [Akkermansiaceae bacterium]|nr:DUF1552 domain-containing protein [Akkermansiaceae bacterium]
MNSVSKNPLNRRRFLRSAAAMIALPSLESFGSTATPVDGPKNFVVIGSYLGLHQNAFYPKTIGKNYEMPDTLKPLAEHQHEFTVFSGLDHRAANGHAAWSNFLCGNSPKTYSLDQMVADKIGQKSRFASIQLTAGSGEANKPMCFTRQGVPLPMIQRPSVFYKQLFVSKEDRRRTEYVLRSGKSALDSVVKDAKRLQQSLPQGDRDKLDEYFESLRAVEKRMDRQLETINEVVPEPDYKLPSYDPITPNLQIESETIMYDLMALALESGSTRVLTLFLDGLGQVFSIDGRALGSGYHGLSHHGNDPAMIRDLVAIESAHTHCLSGFLTQLREKKNAQDKSLLDDTVVLMGTGMGDASRHSNRNLPTLVAGGGFSHEGHVAIDQKDKDSPLLGDLYITLQQKLGMEVESFSNATRNMNDLFS